MLGSLPHLAEYAALLSQQHADLDFVTYIKVEVDPQLAVELRYPAGDIDADLVRNFFEVALHDRLPHGFLGLLDLALGACNRGVVPPLSHHSFFEN